MDPLNQNSKKCLRVHGPIIVGAGPSGIAVAATLSKHGIPSLILERNDCIASLWQNKTYDRLKLHLPKNFCQLPFMSFPTTFPNYPTKHQFISYLESYVHHFHIYPKFNQTVVSAEFDQSSKIWSVKIKEDDFCYFSNWLVVASGENAEPFVPKILGLEHFHGPVVHTCDYKSGSEYKNKRVLVIGCGNSGMEVSLDLCRHNAMPHLVARNTVHILPRDIFGFSTYGIAMSMYKWLPLKIVDKFLLLVTSFILGNTNHYGIKRPKTGPIELKLATGKTPVLDVGQIAQIKSGNIKVMEGVKEITRNGAKFMGGKEKEFDAIILATGYMSNVPTWLKGSDFFSKDGMPKRPFPNGWKGEQGLYTVGFTRRGLHGTYSDAINIAEDIAKHWKTIKNNTSCDSHIIKFNTS